VFLLLLLTCLACGSWGRACWPIALHTAAQQPAQQQQQQQQQRAAVNSSKQQHDL
jgi:predicted small lipoprotein YifL